MIAGIIQGGVGATIDLANMGFGIGKYVRDKRLQERIFNREDNAVQRRVRDLIAAGLSPTLAAGSAAQAGQAVRTTAPYLEKSDPQGNIIAGAMASMELRKGAADIAHTKAQTDLIRNQAMHTQELFRKENLDNITREALNNATLDREKKQILIMDSELRKMDEQINNLISDLETKKLSRRTENLNQMEKRLDLLMQLRDDGFDILAGSRRGGNRRSLTDLPGMAEDLARRFMFKDMEDWLYMYNKLMEQEWDKIDLEYH